jgi:protein-S-isoprenylcysteine O-methyltransferase Ste14
MINKFIKLPVLFVSFFMTLMFLVDLLDVGIRYHFHNQTIISFVILCLGIIIIAVGGYTFRKVKTTVNPMSPELTTCLVTNGIYSISRNPMYIGFLTWLVACALFVGNLTNVLLFPLYILLVNKLYIIPEEEALSKLFIDEFTNYKNEVGRWI